MNEIIPPYREFKKLLQRASGLGLLTNSDVNTALWARDSMALKQQAEASGSKRSVFVRDIPEKSLRAYILMNEIEQVAGNLYKTRETAKQVLQDSLRPTDIALCLIWGNIYAKNAIIHPDKIYYQLRQLGNAEACRLLSARAAELIAVAYLEKLGHHVEDFSIQQLNENCDEWKYYDLRCKDKYIDIKNSRKSFKGSDHYTEHCVPRFKKTRANGDDITIFGVLSPYKKEIQNYLSGSLDAIVLGEVNVKEVRALYKWARLRFGKILDLAGIWTSGYFPGWIFEYSPDHYLLRNEAFRTAPKLVSDLISLGTPIENIPKWLRIFYHERENEPIQTEFSETEWILRDLKSMHSSIGINKRSLIIYAMGVTIESLRKNESVEHILDVLRTNLAINSDLHLCEYFGIKDPLDYIDNMFNSLAIISRELKSQQINLIGFRLIHPAILQGICRDGTILRLLAYCGNKFNGFRCESSPLVFGRNSICPNCRYLICTSCHSCSATCHYRTHQRHKRHDNERYINSWKNYRDFPESDHDDFL